MKKSLVFLHRWMGVALCLIFLVWFVSGIVMMYCGYPGVTAADRLNHHCRMFCSWRCWWGARGCASRVPYSRAGLSYGGSQHASQITLRLQTNEPKHTDGNGIRFSEAVKQGAIA